MSSLLQYTTTIYTIRFTVLQLVEYKETFLIC